MWPRSSSLLCWRPWWGSFQGKMGSFPVETSLKSAHSAGVTLKPPKYMSQSVVTAMWRLLFGTLYPQSGAGGGGVQRCGPHPKNTYGILIPPIWHSSQTHTHTHTHIAVER